MGNSLSIWASIAVEALACSGRLLPVVHPTRPARINAPAAMAAKLVLRISSLLRLVRTYDRSPTGLEYQADVDRHRFRIVCIGRADQCGAISNSPIPRPEADEQKLSSSTRRIRRMSELVFGFMLAESHQDTRARRQPRSRSEFN